MEDRLTSSGLTKLWSKITACITTKIESNNSSIVDKIYPVGSIYMSMNNTSPETLFGGTWEKLAGGRCLVNTGYLDDDPDGGSISVNVNEKGGDKDTKLVQHQHRFEHGHYLNNDVQMFPSGWETQHGYCTYVLNSGVSRFKVAPSTASNARYVFGGKTGSTSAAECGLTFSSYQNKQDNYLTENYGDIKYGNNNANYQPYVGVNMWKRTA